MVESVVFSSAPTPAVAPPTAVTPPGDRPAWLPENFATPEALVASNKELQAELTRLKQGSTAPTDAEKAAADKAAADKAAADAGKTPEQIATEKAEADKVEAEKVIADKLVAGGINYTALQDKFMENGKIDEADFVALEKLGIGRDVVLGHIADKQASADKLRADIVALAGGEVGFEAAAAWSRVNYTPAQRDAYNKAVDSRDLGQMQNAVKALKADFDKATGTVPKFLTPSNAPSIGGDHYESMAQMLADQKNPLYKTDPAFRAKVATKLSRSKI